MKAEANLYVRIAESCNAICSLRFHNENRGRSERVKIFIERRNSDDSLSNT